VEPAIAAFVERSGTTHLTKGALIILVFKEPQFSQNFALRLVE